MCKCGVYEAVNYSQIYLHASLTPSMPHLSAPYRPSHVQWPSATLRRCDSHEQQATVSIIPLLCHIQCILLGHENVVIYHEDVQNAVIGGSTENVLFLWSRREPERRCSFNILGDDTVVSTGCILQ